jgi:hypothetical protein
MFLDNLIFFSVQLLKSHYRELSYFKYAIVFSRKVLNLTVGNYIILNKHNNNSFLLGLMTYISTHKTKKKDKLCYPIRKRQIPIHKK